MQIASRTIILKKRLCLKIREGGTNAFNLT